MSLTNGTAASIETSYRNMFRTGFEQSFQQLDSRLLPYIEIERQASEFDFYDRVGIAEEMTEDTSRYGDNPVSEIELDRRRIGLRDYELGKPIDEKDLIRVATDPTNAYSAAMQASAYRKMDDVIFDGFFGSAYTGKKGAKVIDWVTGGDEDERYINVGAYSAGYSNPITTAGKFKLITGDREGIYVGRQYTEGTTDTTNRGLTLDKLKAVRMTAMRLDAICQDTTLNCFLTSKQFNDLLGIEEVINSDYSVRKNLAEGNVTTFMGYRFIHAERLGTKSAGNRRVIVSLPRCLKLAIGKSLQADMWRLPDKKNIPYIYFKMSVGASRMWGEVSAEISCNE